MNISNVNSLALLLLLSISVHNANAQFGGFNIFRPLQNLLKPVMRFFGGGPRFTDDGTQSPQATGNDKLFPDDLAEMRIKEQENFAFLTVFFVKTESTGAESSGSMGISIGSAGRTTTTV